MPFLGVRSFEGGAITDTGCTLYQLERSQSVYKSEQASFGSPERSKSSLSHLLLPRNCQSIERADLKWLRLAFRKLDDFCPEPWDHSKESTSVSVLPANIYIYIFFCYILKSPRIKSRRSPSRRNRRLDLAENFCSGRSGLIRSRFSIRFRGNNTSFRITVA